MRIELNWHYDVALFFMHVFSSYIYWATLCASEGRETVEKVNLELQEKRGILYRLLGRESGNAFCLDVNVFCVRLYLVFGL